MKPAITFYLLLLYCLLIFKPLISITKDLVSHTFSEAIHLATVHAIYGSNHLQKELDDSESDNSNSKHQTNDKTETEIQLHISFTEFASDLNFIFLKKNYFVANINHVKKGFLTIYSLPPRVS
jgi:Ca2+/Na+ antiporter